MQKFKIQEIILPKTDKGPTILKDEKGTTISGFDTKLKDLTSGTEIEVEIVVSGSYNNIKEWTLVSLAQEPSPASTVQDQTTIRMQIHAQYRIAALSQACTLVAAGKIELAELDNQATTLYTWLIGREQVSQGTDPTTPIDSAEKFWGEMGGKEARDPETIKNLGNLFTACHQDFKGPTGEPMTADEVVKELGHSKKEDITESPADSYRSISLARSK